MQGMGLRCRDAGVTGGTGVCAAPAFAWLGHHGVDVDQVPQQARLLALRGPLASDNIAFSESLGRYLSNDISASRDQPAAPLSSPVHNDNPVKPVAQPQMTSA